MTMTKITDLRTVNKAFSYQHKRRRKEFGALLIYLCTAIAFAAIALLFVMIIIFALPALTQTGEAGPFNWNWQPTQKQFGILPMVVGSVLLASLALLLSFPLAVAIASWIVAIGQGKLLYLISLTIRFMTTIPTVVYAFAAIFLLTPIIRQAMGGTGMSWLTAAIMVSILILPTMVLVLVAGIQPQLERLYPSGLALGFSKVELLWYFALPQSKKTLLSAALLGFGRAIGDTLLPLMLAGNAPQVPQGLTESMRALTAHMALVTANEVGGSAYNSLFVAGFLLLLISSIITFAVKRLTRVKNSGA